MGKTAPLRDHLSPRTDFAQSESPAAEASASRQRLADALQTARETRAALVEAHRARADHTAALAAVPVAEETFMIFLRESAIDLSDGTEAGRAQKEILAAVVRSARARVEELSTATQDADVLGRAVTAANLTVRAARLAIIEEEAEGLAALYNHHAKVALKAEKAIHVLADWALREGDASMLGVRLRALTQRLPLATPEDPGRFQRAYDAQKALLAAFGDTWVDLPVRLMAEPFAVAMSPADDA